MSTNLYQFVDPSLYKIDPIKSATLSNTKLDNNIYTGFIEVDVGGFRQGKSTFDNVDTGFILGIHDGLAKFYIGNTTSYLNWTGTQLNINGLVVDGIRLNPTLYGASTNGTDAYTLTVDPAPTAYNTGLGVFFNADVANSGAASLNINGLGVIVIKKDGTTDLATGDILASSLNLVVYDGTNFQLLSPVQIDKYIVGSMANTFIKSYFNIQLPFILWTGAVDDDTTTPLDNWIRSSADVVLTNGGAMAQFTATGSENIYLDTPFKVSGSADLQWDQTNIIIMDWWAKLPTTSTGDIQMGFVNSSSVLTSVYDSAVNGRATFAMRGSTGVIYATISKNAVGADQTDVSSGITNTNWNNFRIELDLNNQALFYINGVLKATLSGANLTTSASALVTGFGRSNTAVYAVTAPNFSLEMNP